MKDAQIKFKREECAGGMGQSINHNTGCINQSKRWSVQAGGMWQRVNYVVSIDAGIKLKLKEFIMVTEQTTTCAVARV